MDQQTIAEMQVELQRLRAQLELVTQNAGGAVDRANAETIRLTNEGNVVRTKMAAKRALASLPKYDGKTSYRTFYYQFATWYEINSIKDIKNGEQTDVEFQKLCLLSAMTGSAVELCQRLGPGSESWTKCTDFKMYSDMIRQVFCPEAESQLARAEFVARKQGQKESISSYLEHKYALFHQAYPENQSNFTTLLTATINGMYNSIVKRIVRRANPENETQLRTASIQAVANERESFIAGYGESASLDGLAAVTITHQNYRQDEVEDMEIDSINSLKFNGKCYKCGNAGHRSHECYAKTRKGYNKDKKFDKKTPNKKSGRGCFHCGMSNHMIKDCRIKMKEEAKGKQSGNVNKPKARNDGQKVNSIPVEEADSKEEQTNLEERIERLQDFLGCAETLMESP